MMMHSINRTVVDSRLFVTRSLGIVLLLVAVLLLGPTAQAQVLYGSVVGTVTDSTGAAVGGAKITALEVQTGVSQTGTSGSDGILSRHGAASGYLQGDRHGAHILHARNCGSGCPSE
jgi:hypothetical protein